MDFVGDFLHSNLTKKTKKNFIEAEVDDTFQRREKPKEPNSQKRIEKAIDYGKKDDDEEEIGKFSFKSSQKKVLSSSMKKLPRT